MPYIAQCPSCHARYELPANPWREMYCLTCYEPMAVRRKTLSERLLEAADPPRGLIGLAAMMRRPRER